MRQVGVLLVVAVPGLVEHCRHDVGLCLPYAQRVLDVAVILDSSVFTHLHVVDAEVGMYVVALASVVAIEGAAEHAVGLGRVVACAIVVVNLEAQACQLVDVCGEVAPDAVLACLPVAARVVGQVGDGALRVGEAEVLQRASEEAEGLEEKKLIGRLAVEVETAQSGRPDVAQVVVVAHVSVGGIPFLEVMDDGVVVLGINHGAEPWLQHPLELSDGYLLFRAGPCRVASPCGAVACTVYVGAALGVHDVGVAAVVECGVAAVLVDAAHLGQSLRPLSAGHRPQDKCQEELYV